MINIYYDPTLDKTSSKPETERLFNTGSRVITIVQGNNIVDEVTLVSLESLPTFREGEDVYFLVDRNFIPPDDSSPELEQPTDLQLTLEESSETPEDDLGDTSENG